MAEGEIFNVAELLRQDVFYNWRFFPIAVQLELSLLPFVLLFKFFRHFEVALTDDKDRLDRVSLCKNVLLL